MNRKLWQCMPQRDIEDTLREIYGAEISQGLISRITDKILPEVTEVAMAILQIAPFLGQDIPRGFL